MNDSLEAGAEVLDYEIPLFSTVVMAGSGIVGWWNGEVGVTDAMADMAAGVTAKAGLGTAGAMVGKGAGLLFFGPAGAVVFGGVLAVAAASQSNRVVGAVRDWTNQSLATEVRRASDSLVDAVITGLDTKIRILQAKRSQLPGGDPLSDYLSNRFTDQITFFNERLSEARRFDSSQKPAIDSALDAIDLARRSKVHLFKLQEAYRALLASLAKTQASGRRWGFVPEEDPGPSGAS